MPEYRTIWVIEAKGARRPGMPTPAGPQILIPDEPKIGETVAARLLAQPKTTTDEGLVTEWVVRLDQEADMRASVRLLRRPAHGRMRNDDSDPPTESDFTVEVLTELLSGGPTWKGVTWDGCSCRVVLDDFDSESITITRLGLSVEIVETSRAPSSTRSGAVDIGLELRMAGATGHVSITLAPDPGSPGARREHPLRPIEGAWMSSSGLLEKVPEGTRKRIVSELARWADDDRRSVKLEVDARAR